MHRRRAEESTSHMMCTEHIFELTRFSLILTNSENSFTGWVPRRESSRFQYEKEIKNITQVTTVVHDILKPN